ncbi:protein of unknown function [Pseudomonas sp. JV551A1]|uniref:Uncharacterized protein n=1 Tax=Pseudomonas inefficax TaxID=2078786 RepID=A0AAQ1P8L5_9PSED|nr:protein of unknown function [Pseudomonas sp. JV551A1]SPO61854.1 protein of unknown function [Pseudomonas inefficax]
MPAMGREAAPAIYATALKLWGRFAAHRRQARLPQGPRQLQEVGNTAAPTRLGSPKRKMYLKD